MATERVDRRTDGPADRKGVLTIHLPSARPPVRLSALLLRSAGPPVLLSALLLLSGGPAVRLSAQVPPVAQDTTHRIRPIGAFLRSLLLPGWGQAATGRPVAGAVFVTWEGVTAMMTLKAQAETHYLKESGSKNLSAKRQEVQDWLVLWIFNHLFSGAEAFVAAHLQDFPRELKVQAFPGGIGVSVPAPRP